MSSGLELKMGYANLIFRGTRMLFVSGLWIFSMIWVCLKIGYPGIQPLIITVTFHTEITKNDGYTKLPDVFFVSVWLFQICFVCASTYCVSRFPFRQRWFFPSKPPFFCVWDFPSARRVWWHGGLAMTIEGYPLLLSQSYSCMAFNWCQTKWCPQCRIVYSLIIIVYMCIYILILVLGWAPVGPST